MSKEILERLRSGTLSGTERVRLDLSAGLNSVPDEVRGLADTLEVLNLSGNQLTDLPPWLPELKRLRVIFCPANPFRELPEVLGRCPALEMAGFRSCRLEQVRGAALPERLRWLILTDNHLTSLPPDLGRRPRLQKLMLSGNRLTSLPPEMAGLENLELLRLAANRLEHLPEWLWDLPALAWLAVAGNPCTAVRAGFRADGGEGDGPGLPEEQESRQEFAEIPWHCLEIGPLLGEGASGHIHRAVLAGQVEGLELPEHQPVAVKLFKGAMTSDGLPACEMEACLRVGGQEHCLGALGRITGHPEGVEGLVMPLLPAEFRPLAGPPDLASCTRDVYAEDCRFTVPQAARLLSGVARAAARVHREGLMHGDLYAHNLLHTPDGRVLLSDFGAASPLPRGLAEKAERIEVRAFGVLVREVLERTLAPGSAEEAAAVGRWSELAVRCGLAEPEARPGFSTLLMDSGQ